MREASDECGTDHHRLLLDSGSCFPSASARPSLSPAPDALRPVAGRSALLAASSALCFSGVYLQSGTIRDGASSLLIKGLTAVWTN